MRRISVRQDEVLAIGDNPATDREGAQRMGFPYALVGPDPGAHFQSLAEMMHSRRPPEGSEPRSNDRLRRLEFYGEPYLGPLQAPKSNSDGAG